MKYGNSLASTVANKIGFLSTAIISIHFAAQNTLLIFHQWGGSRMNARAKESNNVEQIKYYDVFILGMKKWILFISLQSISRTAVFKFHLMKKTKYGFSKQQE